MHCLLGNFTLTNQGHIRLKSFALKQHILRETFRNNKAIDSTPNISSEQQLLFPLDPTRNAGINHVTTMLRFDHVPITLLYIILMTLCSHFTRAQSNSPSFVLSSFYVWDQNQALRLNAGYAVAGTLNTSIRFLFNDKNISPPAACSIVWSPAASQKPPVKTSYSCDFDDAKEVFLQRYQTPEDFAIELTHYVAVNETQSANASASEAIGQVRTGMFSVGSNNDSRNWKCVLGYCTPPNDKASVEVPWSLLSNN